MTLYMTPVSTRRTAAFPGQSVRIVAAAADAADVADADGGGTSQHGLSAEHLKRISQQGISTGPLNRVSQESLAREHLKMISQRDLSAEHLKRISEKDLTTGPLKEISQKGLSTRSFKRPLVRLADPFTIQTGRQSSNSLLRQYMHLEK